MPEEPDADGHDHGDKPPNDGAEEDEHHHDHSDHHHEDPDGLGFAFLTISTSRTLDEDPAGDAGVELLEAADHDIVTRDLIPDERDRIQGMVDTLSKREDVDCVLTSGGTGVTPDDLTVEAVRPILDRELPGFGELFRDMSRAEVGTRAMHSRATAGISGGVPIFLLPGSKNAVQLAVADLIVPEAPHLVAMATRED
jgi:molybdenum cofactor biosynthesis protein B